MSTLTVTRTIKYPDIEWTETSVIDWSGYTAAEARRERLSRLRDGRADVVLDGDALIVTRDREEWVEVERLEWADDDLQLDLLAMERNQV
ncbi:hypothetical protein [Cumulibacter soli]|uniref:hypothetical protein n=1 Tax=Cumulibacter soli TaxID=2546344 RepID=UPI0010688BCB|nr:hypothetical protein [Cumulibacter soli]